MWLSYQLASLLLSMALSYQTSAFEVARAYLVSTITLTALFICHAPAPFFFQTRDRFGARISNLFISCTDRTFIIESRVRSSYWCLAFAYYFEIYLPFSFSLGDSVLSGLTKCIHRLSKVRERPSQRERWFCRIDDKAPSSSSSCHCSTDNRLPQLISHPTVNVCVHHRKVASSPLWKKIAFELQ